MSLAPAAASFSAIALPIPRPAPVTSAVLQQRLKDIFPHLSPNTNSESASFEIYCALQHNFYRCNQNGIGTRLEFFLRKQCTSRTRSSGDYSPEDQGKSSRFFPRQLSICNILQRTLGSGALAEVLPDRSRKLRIHS